MADVDAYFNRAEPTNGVWPLVRLKDQGDYYVQLVFDESMGEQSDPSQTDPSQAATLISLLKGCLEKQNAIEQQLISLNAKIDAGISVSIL